MCKVCGSENAKYYPAKRQTLCIPCAKDTPRKIDRQAFDLRYWAGDQNVPEGTKREFYSDYLASCDTVEEYIRSTVTVAE